MADSSQNLFDALDSAFLDIDSHWILFEECTIDDLFLDKSLRAKLKIERIPSLKILVGAKASELYCAHHFTERELRQLKKSAKTLFEREVYSSKGFDGLLKQLRNLKGAVLDCSLAGDISTRASNALARRGIITYRDLSCITVKQLCSVKSFGRRSLTSVTIAVEKFLARAKESVPSPAIKATGEYLASKKSEFVELLRDAFALESPKTGLSHEECAFIREKELSAILDCAKRVLTPQLADIFERRHFGEKKKSLSELALKYGLSRERMGQLDKKAVIQVKDLFRRDSIVSREQTNSFYETFFFLNPHQLRLFVDYLLLKKNIDIEIIGIIAFDAGIILPPAFKLRKESGHKKRGYHSGAK